MSSRRFSIGILLGIVVLVGAVILARYVRSPYAQLTPPATSGPSFCGTACGDGFLTSDEECDDGNTKNNDGCSALCKKEVGWKCDTPGADQTECDPVCGDGIVAGGEQCDDGNTKNGDGCSSTCGLVGASSSASSGHNAPPECGDGNRDPGEECDDGDTVSGDGCSDVCEEETGWQCKDLSGSSSSKSGGNGSSTAGGGGATCCRNFGGGQQNVCIGPSEAQPSCPGGQIQYANAAACDAACAGSGDSSSTAGGSCGAGNMCVVGGGQNGCVAGSMPTCPNGQTPQYLGTSCGVTLSTGTFCSGGCYTCPDTSQQGSCTDSDGEDVRVATTMTKNGTQFIDTCHPTLVSLVLEKTCNGLGERGRFCQAGYSCLNGACTVPDPDDLTDFQQTCSDTDAGIDLGTAGTLTYTTGGTQTYNVSDSCESASVVLETYCVNDHHGFIAPTTWYEKAPIPCPNGTTCQNGACKP
jgi:cysteine-rich repeat protein